MARAKSSLVAPSSLSHRRPMAQRRLSIILATGEPPGARVPANGSAPNLAASRKSSKPQLLRRKASMADDGAGISTGNSTASNAAFDGFFAGEFNVSQTPP